MARIVKVLVLVVVVAAVGGWLVYDRLRAGAEGTLRAFFACVEGGSEAALLEAIDPGMDKSYDRRLVAAWLRALVRERGSFTGLVPEGGEYSVEVSTGVGTMQRYQGKIGFAKGPLELQLVFVEGKLSSISTQDPAAVALVAQADRLPADATPYAERGRAFWQAACSDDPGKAVAMMFPGLVEAVGGADAFVARMRASGRTGKLTDVRFQGIQPGEGPSTSTFVYQCRFGEEVVPARVGFWFKSLQVHLVSFDLAAAPAPSAP